MRVQGGQQRKTGRGFRPGQKPEYKLVVRGGTVVDGSGRPRFVGDVGVGFDGKIAAVGQGLGRGAEEIDAAGKLVTPGFIDVYAPIPPKGHLVLPAWG